MKIDPKKAEEFLLAHPELLVALGAVALCCLQKGGNVPAWVKDLPPMYEKLAGPWRGPGSFGRGFGPQVRHR